jgi:hypothetical protein
VAALVVAGAAALGPGAGTAAACDRWASAQGSDANAGTAARPFRSVGRLVRRLAPGQEGCLASGSVFTGSFRIAKRGITLRASGSARAEIRGAITIARGADGVTLAGLAVRGPRSSRGPIVLVQGHRARLLRNDVTGLSTAPGGVVCVQLDRVVSPVFDGNAVHHCTRATSRRGWSTGILARGTRGGRVANNFVYGIAGEAVALAGARRLAVHHNVVDGNTTGIVLRSGARSNRIVSNIISRAGANLVRSTLSRATGRTNLVAANCLWRGYRGNLAGAGRGFVTRRNLVASPRFVNRPRGFQLRAGPCFGKRPYATMSLRRAAAIVRPTPRVTPRRPVARPRPAPPPPSPPPPPPARVATGGPAIVPAFRVRYRLLGFPGSVRVVALTAVRLPRGARVRLRCVEGCRADLPLRVSNGRAALTRFRGSRLGRGTVFDVRASRPGAIAHVARVTVVGLPGGVRIEHGCAPAADPALFVPCSAYR